MRGPRPTARRHDSPEPLRQEPLAEECTIDDFAKVDLRVARVVAAEDVPEARKLVQPDLEPRRRRPEDRLCRDQGGLRPEQLVGRLVVCVANLAPRKMKFGTSEGMVVAAGPGGKDIFLLSVDEGAVPGSGSTDGGIAVVTVPSRRSRSCCCASLPWTQTRPAVRYRDSIAVVLGAPAWGEHRSSSRR